MATPTNPSGVLGFLLAGPWGALVLAAVSNYVSKKDDEAGEAVRGFGKTGLETYNYLTKLNAKYDISGKVGGAMSSAFDSIEMESESLSKLKETVSETKAKVTQLDKEYDFVGKAKQVTIAAGTVTDSAIDKVTELDRKYDFIGSASKAVKSAIDKAAQK